MCTHTTCKYETIKASLRLVISLAQTLHSINLSVHQSIRDAAWCWCCCCGRGPLPL